MKELNVQQGFCYRVPWCISLKSLLQLIFIILGIRNYNCHECPLKFLRKSHLQRHTQTVHHIKAYQICPNCGRKFKHIKYLKQHMQKHGENHYKCPLCEASFPVSYALKSHMLKNHPGIEMPPPGTVLKNNLNFLQVSDG